MISELGNLNVKIFDFFINPHSSYQKIGLGLSLGYN